MGDNSLLNIGLDHKITTAFQVDLEALDMHLRETLHPDDYEVARQLMIGVAEKHAKLRQAAQTGLKTLRDQRNAIIEENEQLKADMHNPHKAEHAEIRQMLDDLESAAKGEGYDKGYDTALENLRDEWVETLQNLTGMNFTEALTLAETLVSPDVLALETVFNRIQGEVE